MQDVIIIGGGPAGSTAASFLAKHGHSVTILEKERFPREHVGESLLPFCYKTFDALGVLDEMKRLFVRKPTVRFATIDGKQSTNWCFNAVIPDESFLSFQVDRKVFDTMLLDNSRKLGVDVHEQTKVTDVKFDTEQDKVVVSATGPNGEKQTYEGRFLIDASGRSTFLASKNNWRTSNVGFERTAVWTHFIDVKNMIGGLEEGSSLIVYLGGNKRGWIWVFPLERDRITAGVVVDSFYLRDKKRELQEAGSENWQRDFFFNELNESPFVREIIDGAEMMMDVIVEGDYSYNSNVKHGPRYALIGDASRFIDPIFSSGIFLSTKSAWLVADALHEMLSSGDLNNNQPLLKAYEYINGAYNFVYRLITLFYNPHTISFAEAATFFNEYSDHQHAMAAGHFILSGDFFENHKKYHEFLDVLEAPRNFQRYKNVVMDRKKSNIESCNLKPEERSIIFPKKSLRMAEQLQKVTS
ncbi:MAG: FAD-dependent oxidoreductase [Anaerolineales bacterium]|nr:FAD-dependent oxidoreductase [Anaerolineales bacterium]